MVKSLQSQRRISDIFLMIYEFLKWATTLSTQCNVNNKKFHPAKLCKKTININNNEIMLTLTQQWGFKSILQRGNIKPKEQTSRKAAYRL